MGPAASPETGGTVAGECPTLVVSCPSLAVWRLRVAVAHPLTLESGVPLVSLANVRIVCPVAQLLPSAFLMPVEGTWIGHGSVKLRRFNVAAVSDPLERLEKEGASGGHRGTMTSRRMSADGGKRTFRGLAPGYNLPPLHRLSLGIRRQRSGASARARLYAATLRAASQKNPPHSAPHRCPDIRDTLHRNPLRTSQ